ncbi:MAG: uroporphyrinogen-III synthase, partial [Chloroflexota bacterium]
MDNLDQSHLLAGRRIAVPESRELNLFTGMLEVRGAEVIRCPLVSIYDSPDQEAVETWLRHFVSGNFDDLILLTGEGLRRLLGFAERAGGTLHREFVAALAKVRKITRGPKPGNALRKIGLKADLLGSQPTTEGVMDTLSAENLAGRKIAVQLYGTHPNRPLIDFLEGRGAIVSAVAPYVYADDSEDAQLVSLVERIVRKDLDAIAFTSTPQVTRLVQIAKKQQLADELIAG